MPADHHPILFGLPVRRDRWLCQRLGIQQNEWFLWIKKKWVTPSRIRWVYPATLVCTCMGQYVSTNPMYISGQNIIFHQPRFPWNKGISLTKLPFKVRSCEVAIIWPDIYIYICISFPEILSKESIIWCPTLDAIAGYPGWSLIFS